LNWGTNSELAKKTSLYFYLAPALFYMIFFSAYPLVYSLYTSLTKLSLSPPKQIFIGLNNFNFILQDSIFHAAIINTFKFVSISVTLEFSIGFILALILNQNIKGSRIFRVICILPMTMMPALVGFIWRFLYHGDIGLINYLLSLIGISGLAWLGNPNTAMIAVILTDIWQWTPFCFLILLAGLQALPAEPFEAAKIDGASDWGIFKNITLPLLKPAIAVALLFRVIDAFKIFDLAYVMTGGGPGNATMVMSFYAYRWAFIFQDFGVAAAASYLLLIIVSILFTVLINVLKLE
jgi:multiple sugar transport system permease protein